MRQGEILDYLIEENRALKEQVKGKRLDTVYEWTLLNTSTSIAAGAGDVFDSTEGLPGMQPDR